MALGLAYKKNASQPEENNELVYIYMVCLSRILLLVMPGHIVAPGGLEVAM